MNTPNIIGPKQGKALLDRYRSAVILTMALLICSATFAQVDTTKPYNPPTKSNFQYDGRVKVPNALIGPTDTFRLAVSDTGALATKNGVQYVYRKVGSLLKWWPISGSGGGSDITYFENGPGNSELDTILRQKDPNTFLFKAIGTDLPSAYKQIGDDSIKYLIRKWVKDSSLFKIGRQSFNDYKQFNGDSTGLLSGSLIFSRRSMGGGAFEPSISVDASVFGDYNAIAVDAGLDVFGPVQIMSSFRLINPGGIQTTAIDQTTASRPTGLTTSRYFKWNENFKRWEGGYDSSGIDVWHPIAWQYEVGSGVGGSVDSSVYATRGRLYKVADSLAIALAPNLSVYNAGPSGERVLFVRSDTVWGKKLVQGTGITITNNADSTLTVAATGGSGWAQNGSTVTSEKWLGTIDNFDLPIRTNNVERMRFTNGGKTLFGYSSQPESGAWTNFFSGASWFGDTITYRKPTFAPIKLYSTASNISVMQAGAATITFTGAASCAGWVGTSYVQAPIYYTPNTNYAQFATGGTPGNNMSNPTWLFTKTKPTTNSGSNTNTLVSLVSLIDRGSSDATEWILKLSATVTGTANDLRAIEVLNGKSIIKGLQTSLSAKTTTYTAVADDYTITGDATGGAFTITLPTAVGCAGRIYVIKKIDSSGNTVTVATTSSQTIDGSTTYTGLSAQWKHATFQSDGANWLIISSN